MASFDVAVIGLGAMGSAALAALSARSHRVIGIDRYMPGHDRGSSHGATRVIRLGYFEHPSYVPLLRAAKTCLYTMTPDGDFLIDRLPGIRRSSSRRPVPATASSSPR
jgi:glycine/D-amino acid oxidase-like deaminating enzyme